MLKGNRKNPLTSHTFDSILGEGMVIDGRLKVSVSALINGTVTGDIEVDPKSDMVVIGVGETGVVRGNIAAHQVMIGGLVMGNVRAYSRLEMMATGRVEGDLEYSILVMDEGAIIKGKIIPLDSQDTLK